MEFLLSIFAYLLLIICTLAAAAIVCAPIVGVMHLCRVKLNKKRLLCIYLLVLLIVCAALVWLCHNPIISCPEEYEELFTDEIRRSVKSAVGILYSPQLPLIPSRIEVQSIQWVDSLQEYETVFEIYYLCVPGSVIMSLGDGIAVEKPLSGL